MQLGLFTPVFQDLTLDQMLTELRAYPAITALELGTGGWPGASHIAVDTLLDNPAAARDYRSRLATPASPSARSPATATPSTPTPPSPTATTKHSARRYSSPSSWKCHRRYILRLPRRLRTRRHAQLDHRLLAARVRHRAGLAVGRAPHPLLARGRSLRRKRTTSASRSKPTPASWSTTRRRCSASAQRPAPSLGINLDPSHLWWQGVDIPTAIRAWAPPSTTSTPKTLPLNPPMLQRNGVLDTKSYADLAQPLLELPLRRLGPQRARVEADRLRAAPRRLRRRPLHRARGRARLDAARASPPPIACSPASCSRSQRSNAWWA